MAASTIVTAASTTFESSLETIFIPEPGPDIPLLAVDRGSVADLLVAFLRERLQASLAALDALEWQEITDSNLPTINDEVVRCGDDWADVSSVWVFSHKATPASAREWHTLGFKWFRPLNTQSLHTSELVCGVRRNARFVANLTAASVNNVSGGSV